MSKNPSSATRTRNYVSIGYPESMPEDWLTILQESHVPCVVSPLHDKDKNPEGEDKKPHYHIMLLFDSVKTQEQAQKVFDSIKAVKCQAVNSIRGEARYFLHLDNPEKYQYDVKDVKCLGGVDYQVLIQLPSDRYGIIRELLQFIESNDIRSFSELLRWTSLNREDWFRALCDSCAYIIKEHIASRQYTFEHNLEADTSMWKVPGPSQKGGQEDGK